MLKRLLIFFLSVMMVLSCILPVGVSAEEEMSEEGKICTHLGILKGHTGVVDAAYLRTRPTRLQAAIMFLRLKGLENKALNYNGDVNFADAGTVAWKQGQNVLSYLKAHPELGWIGDGTYFRPSALLDAKAYYKVLLETLGYKQILDGSGDFSWSAVLEFAEDKGLKKAAKDSNFTVNSLAVATVEALKVKLKNSDKRLIDRLIEDGDVDEDVAEDYGLYHSGINVKVKAVRAISGNRVEIEFDGQVDRDAAEDDEMYVLEQGSTDLEVDAARMKNSSTVVLETAGLKEGYSYTLKIDGQSYSFKGVKKNTGAPELVSVECKDSSRLELYFDRVLDHVSAQDTGAYTISGITIKSVEMDASNTMVRLATEGIQSYKSYELKISNLKNGDGVVKKLITKRFTGFKDTTAPKPDKVTVLSNTRLRLSFSDKNGLDERSAEGTDNYRITWDDGTLDVISAKAMDLDRNGLLETVELVTEEQSSGKGYVLKVVNIADDSESANRISKEIRKEFRGKRKDTSSPTVSKNPVVISNNKLEIIFEDASAMNIDTVTDLGNYTFSDDLDAIKAEIKDPHDLYATGGKTVILTTTEMEKSKSYYVTISGVQDEFGNEIKTTSGSSNKRYRFSGRTADRTPPYVTSLSCDGNREVELNFDDRLDRASAENVRNYRIDGLYLVTDAQLSDNEKTVTLETGYLSEGEKHTIQLNGIKDLAGNAMSDVKVYVEVDDDSYDETPAEVDYIEAVNEDEIWVHFDGKVRATSAKLKAGGLTFTQLSGASVLDEETTVVLQTTSPMQDKTYEVTSITDIKDYYNNKSVTFDDDLDFDGTTMENDPPEVDSWDQHNIRTFRVIFNEPVLLLNNYDDGIKDPKGSSLGWKAEINPEDEESNEGYSTVDFIASKEIPADREYYFDFTKMVMDYAGTKAKDEDDTSGSTTKATILEAYMEDDEDPYIEYVEAVSRNKVQVVFNEELEKAGSYRITYYDDRDRKKELDIKDVEVDYDDKEKVNIYTDDQMDGETVYTLIPVTGAIDLAGNKMDPDDLEFDFEGSDIVSVDYLQGVQVIDVNTIRVTKNSTIGSVKSVVELDSDGDVISENLIKGTPRRLSDTRYEIATKVPLLEDLYYRVSVDNLTYRFRGIIENSDITVNGATGRITYDGQDEDEQTVEAVRLRGTETKVLEVDLRSDDHFYIHDTGLLKNGDIVYVTVLDDDGETVLYGAKLKIQGVAFSSEKKLTSFKFLELNPDVVGSIDESNKTIRLTVPNGTDKTDLIATFSHSQESTVKVDSKIQVSGVTPNNFTNPVYYTVVAEDGSSVDYKVTVSAASAGLSSEKKLTSFKFLSFEPDVAGVIDESNRTVRLTVPYGKDITGLKATFSSSAKSTVMIGSKVQVSGSTVNDFTYPIVYTVVAENGSEADYTVTVSVASANIIEGVQFIDAKSFRVTKSNRINQVDSVVEVDSAGNVISRSLITGTPLRISDTRFEIDVRRPLLKSLYYKVSVDGLPYRFRGIVEDCEIAVNGTTRKISYWEQNTSLQSVVVEKPDGTKPGVSLRNGSYYIDTDEALENGDVLYVYVLRKSDGAVLYGVKVTLAGVTNLSSEKKLTSFKFIELNPDVIGVIDENNKTIELTVPYGTNRTKLVASFINSDKSTVKIGSRTQVSGDTENDFTDPVYYSVIAEDGSKVDYKVMVKVVESAIEKRITSFRFDELTPAVEGSIDNSDHTIILKVPFDTDIKHLTPTIKITEDTTVKPSSGAEVDFSDPVTYAVTAKDTSTQKYTVYVKKEEGSSHKAITSFSFVNPKVYGEIDEQNKKISLVVPYGTDKTSLIAIFKNSEHATVKVGAKIQDSGNTANDFTKPVYYTVIAEDGSSVDYEVTVETAESAIEKRITSFRFEELTPAVEGVIDNTKHEIIVTVPHNTNVQQLKPTIRTTENTSVKPESEETVDFREPVTYTVTAEDSSTQKYTVYVTKETGSSEKAIKAFALTFGKFWPSVKGVIDEENSTITCTVRDGTDITNLTPIIKLSEKAVCTPKSGERMNFSDPVVYTVKAEDGSTKEYTVTVKTAESAQKQIIEFGFAAPTAKGVINQANRTIAVTVPYGTDVTNLAAVFKASDNTTVKVGDAMQISGTTGNSFVNPVVYKVTAQDSTSQDYTVTVSVAGEADKAMTGFGFYELKPLALGKISERRGNAIVVLVPSATDVSALKATFYFIGKSVEVNGTAQISGETVNDFSSPVTYTVIGHDGSRKDYKVTVMKWH